MNLLTRRMFLRRSAAAAGGAPALLSGRPAGSGPNDRIRVALIGAGVRGRADLAAFLSDPATDCPVVCDVDDGRLAAGAEVVAKARSQRPEAVKDFRRVVERKDIDVCLVATPDHWHALQTVYACQAGKDVYVEKPLATTIAEGKAMAEAVRRHDRIAQMGTQWRSAIQCQEAAELIRSGKIGKICQVRAWACSDSAGGLGHPPDSDPPSGVDYDLWLGPAPRRPFNRNRFHTNFRWFWDYAGGLMTDWGVHLLNVALWVMGAEYPVSVVSVGGRYVLDDNTETPDTQVTVFEFPSWHLVWEHRMLSSLGPNGRSHGVSFNGSEATLTLDKKSFEVFAEPKKRDLTMKRVVNPQEPDADATEAHVRNFLDCVRSRRQPVMNMSVSHAATAIAHLGNIAALTKSKIIWDSHAERVVGNEQANSLLSRAYRQPWSLPYASP